MPKNLTLILLASVVASSIVHLHAADAAPIAIGWRGDGYSGVMPPDCKPPKDFDGVTGKNMKWKVPLPNHGNSAPLIVAGKVFVTCDGGWPEGQDCPQMLCFDADTGKELWRRDLDHFDNLPEAEAKAAKADRAEAWKRHHANNTLLWELRHNNPDAARQAAIAEQIKKAAVVEIREPVVEWLRSKIGTTEAFMCGSELMNRLKKVGFTVPQWGWRCMGVAMPTPASDGRAVYVATGHRTLSAFDFDGKKLWQVVITQNIPGEGAIFTEEFAHSPFLVEGKLLMHWFNHLWCYEPTSGKLLWSTKTKPIPAHSMGQPTVLRLDAGGKPVTCIFTTWGQLIRLSDGKVLLDKLAWFGGCGIMSGDGKDVVWGKNGAEGGKPREERLHYSPQLKGVFGIRFHLDATGETATSEIVDLPYTDAEMGWGLYPIYHQGRIYCTNGQVLSWDGKQANIQRNLQRHFTIGSNGNILADDRLYGQLESRNGEKMQKKNTINAERTSFIRWLWTQDGRSLEFFDNPVEVLPAPLDMPAEQQRKIMAQIGDARLGPHGGIFAWHNSYKTPSAAGDRLYVRTFDNLYCFAPEVHGTLKDEPAKVTAIRNETKAESLLPALASASAQERYEAVKRLGSLKQALSSNAAEAVAKLLTSDPHDEIRLAAMQTLDLCDPAGTAGWTALATKVFSAVYGKPNTENEKKSLARMFDILDASGVAVLVKHWAEAETEPLQRLALLDLATRLAWKNDTMLKSALIAAQDPKRWGNHPSMNLLPLYFSSVQAAADPAVAEILVKVYAQNISMESTFRRHLTTEKFLAWLEPIAVQAVKVYNGTGSVIQIWNKTGPAAIPSMKRVAAAMNETDPKLDERGKAAQLEYRKAIEAAIAEMEKK